MTYRIVFLFLLVAMSGLVWSQQVTFYKDVAPIIIDNCYKCHRDDAVAPFRLKTYKDVASKAKLIQHVTQTKYMPPWTADPKFRRYSNERLLTKTQIETIKKWVEGGKLAGNKLNMPKVPAYSNKSTIPGEPDMVLKMEKPLFLPGDNKERFLAIKLPYELPEDKDVMAIEFVPDNRKLVHHMNVSLYPKGPNDCVYAGDMIADRGSSGTREQHYYAMDLLDASGHIPDMIYYAGWVPGMSPQVYGGNFGIKLPRRGVFVLDVLHFAATPVDDYDNSYINIYFKDKNQPVTREVAMMNVGSGTTTDQIKPPLQLAPNKIETFKINFVLTTDLSVLYVMAHMHLLGKKFLAYGITAGGRRINILRINEWDFNWQEMYQFEPMLFLPEGTEIFVEATYDNTVNNPNNPFNPPQTIYSTGNMETTNEMLNLIFIAVEHEPGDENLKVR